MNSRERVLTAFRRKEPDRIPRHIELSALLEGKIRQMLGVMDLAEYFRYDIRDFAGYRPTNKKGDFSRYPSAKPLPNFPGTDLTEWGKDGMVVQSHPTRQCAISVQ